MEKKSQKKRMKFYNFILQVFIFWNPYMITYYELSLSIINVCRCYHFTLLSLYNIFIFMQLSLSICHCFYKNILNKITEFNPQALD